MLLPLIFWLSCSSLAVEILLARVFAVSQWHHLSFMVISLVMFGFAAGGTYWSLHTLRGSPRDLYRRAHKWAEPLASLYALSVPLGLLVLLHLPLDYFRMPLESVQVFYLLGLYPLLAIPFFITGLILSLSFAALPEQTGRLYFATMAGSALGSALPVLLLRMFSEGPSIILVAMLPLGAYYLHRRSRPSAIKGVHAIPGWRWVGGLLSMGLVGYWVIQGPPWLALEPNPYKALSQVGQFPDTRLMGSHTSLRGHLQRVRSPYLRFAPGLSLQFSHGLPASEVIYRDGDAPTYLYSGRGADLQFARHTLSYSGYHLHPGADKVLLIIQNGGLAPACALASQATEIVVLSSDPRVAVILGDHYHLSSKEDHPRRFLARDSTHYDLIHLENWGYSLPGTAALEQDYLLTREAFQSLLGHLSDSGILVLSRRLLLPPSDALRIWAAAYQAIEKLGVVDPAHHLALFRNWDTVTYIIGRQPLTDLDQLSSWAERMNFDPVYLPTGTPAWQVNRFNQFPGPYLYQGIKKLAAALAEDSYDHFLQRQNLDLAPATDQRPYPNRFLKWSRLSHLHETTGQRFYTLWMSGELVVMVVLALALVLALIFLGLPLPRTRRDPGGVTLGFVAYFLSVGVGFMGVEMYLIHAYSLITGHGVVSLALTLGGMLFFAGLGGLHYQRRGVASLKGDMARLVVVLIPWLILTPWVVARLLRVSEGASLALALAWLAPVAFFMGIPFPGGMAALGRTPRQRCFGWSMNGIASVVAAVAAVPLALTLGDPALGWTGFLAYGVAWICLWQSNRRQLF